MHNRFYHCMLTLLKLNVLLVLWSWSQFFFIISADTFSHFFSGCELRHLMLSMSIYSRYLMLIDLFETLHGLMLCPEVMNVLKVKNLRLSIWCT